MTHGCARRSPSLTLVQALLPSAELASHVNAAFREGHEGTAVLPPLVTGIEGKAVAVPLQLMQACGMQHGSVVLVGDAAHAVHPLAGQGLNLGLQDALSLVAHMCRAQAAGGAADDFVALQASSSARFLLSHHDAALSQTRRRRTRGSGCPPMLHGALPYTS
jgi:2-polyprenyl-6-methoxyphenol hydroxylase-like FAD-dependent oxidoreductase